jgi:WhiB family redox-sensing transcriptional regulator
VIREPAGRDWRSAAMCAGPGIDPESFFPIDSGEAGAAAVAVAKQVCAACPVRAECLADAMGAEDPAERWGVIGGLSATERAALFARDRVPVPVVSVLVIVGLPGVQLGLFDLDGTERAEVA